MSSAWPAPLKNTKDQSGQGNGLCRPLRSWPRDLFWLGDLDSNLVDHPGAPSLALRKGERLLFEKARGVFSALILPYAYILAKRAPPIRVINNSEVVRMALQVLDFEKTRLALDNFKPVHRYVCILLRVGRALKICAR